MLLDVNIFLLIQFIQGKDWNWGDRKRAGPEEKIIEIGEQKEDRLKKKE